MINLPFQLPTQLGRDEPFEQVMQAPPIIRYTTMISGAFDPSKVSEATNLLLGAIAGTIYQFWNGQTQNANLSGLGQYGTSMKMPGADIRYQRNQNISQLDVTLYPEAIVNIEEALAYDEQRHEKDKLPLKFGIGYVVKIDVAFKDWGLIYAMPLGHKTWPAVGWASGGGVGPVQCYVGKSPLKDRQYFELTVKALPKDVPPDDVHTLGGTDDGNYTDSPIKHHTGAADTWKWPSELNTFTTPCVGIVREDVLINVKEKPIKNPYEGVYPGLTPNTVGGVALSMMVGRVRTHTRTVTHTGGYTVHNDQTSDLNYADFLIAGPDVTDTTPRFFAENEIIGRDGYLYQVAFGNSGMAPATGPDSSNATPGTVSQFVWEGLTWFYLGGVTDGLLNLTTRGFVNTGLPAGDSSFVYLPSPLVVGTNYVIAAGDIPADGNAWAAAPAIAPDGYAMSGVFADTTYVGGDHLSQYGIGTNHITYAAGADVVTETDTYGDPVKYGDIFTGVPGATGQSEIPPGHGPGHTFPILKDGQWPGDSGVALEEIKVGDTIMVAVDMGKGRIWFGKNDRWQGRPGKSVPAIQFDPGKDAWYPAASGFGPFKALLRLGLGLKYDLPSGFEPAGGDTVSFDIPYDIS